MRAIIINPTPTALTVYDIGRFAPGETEVDFPPEKLDLIRQTNVLRVRTFYTKVIKPEIVKPVEVVKPKRVRRKRKKRKKRVKINKLSVKAELEEGKLKAI